MKKNYIAIVATIAAGKTTAAKYFEDKGFYYYRLSDAIYDEAERLGLDNRDRVVLQDVGDKMRSENGFSVLADIAVEKFKKLNKNKFVIDSIRSHHELRKLHKEYKNKLLIIAIDAPIEVRYRRIVSRDEYDEKEYSFKKFKQINKRDLGVGNKENEQNNRRCLDMADLSLQNSGTLKQLHRKLDKIYKKFIL